MNEWDGSDDSDRDGLAPVIPLFAERMPPPSGAASARAIAPNHPAFAGGSRGRHDAADADGAPRRTIEPLRPNRTHSVRFVEVPDEPDDLPVAEGRRHVSGDPVSGDSVPGGPVSGSLVSGDSVARRGGSVPGRADADDDRPDPQAHAEFAERALLRKLRTRSLSVREARGVLAGFELAGDEIDDIVDRFEQSRYLDDAALAEQLVHTGASRKGQGRHAIAQTMSARGIPRDVADAALADLPDDDLERALAYAQSKAASLARLDPQTGLRRLVGQLTRRGYPSHVAMTAARQALDEQTRPRGPFFS